MPNIRGMDLSIIIDEIDRCSASTGLMPTTICQKAFNNPLYYERAKRRAEKVKADLAKLRAFVADSGVSHGREAAE